MSGISNSNEAPASNTGASPQKPTKDSGQIEPQVDPRTQDAVQVEAVRRFQQGWRVVPLHPGQKRPIDNGWNTKTFESAEEVREAFPVSDTERNIMQPNLGVALGGTGKAAKLVCVDLDAADPRVAELALPATGLIDGRPGAPRSHRFYRVEHKGKLKKEAYSSKLADRVLIELLADGQQVVLPPSFYADKGETRAWVEDGEAATVGYEELLVASGRAAAFAEIDFLWRQLDGQHHKASLPLVGGLLRAGIEPDTIEALLYLVWSKCERHPDRGEVHNAVYNTVEKRDKDEPFTGWKALRNMVTEEQSKAIQNILQLLGSDSDERPRVVMDSGEVGVIADRAWKAIEKANDPPRLFQRGGRIARINPVKIREEGEDGATAKLKPTIETVGLDALRGELSREIAWVKPNKDGHLGLVSPALDVLRTISTEPSDRIKLPVVSRVVSHPIFGADGSLRTKPGYHAGSQTYLWLGDDLTLAAVPEKPDTSDVVRAKTLLIDELLADFPFDGEASLANALAMGLLPFGREFINSPTPMHFIEAPTQGSGKDLLIKSFGMVWNGRQNVPSMPQTGDEEEWRKAVLALVREGADFFYIANVKGLFASRVLEQSITESEATGRVLGASDMAVGEVTFNWLGTGNNAVAGADMARRICPTRLDAGVSNPYARKGFRHALPHWALENRSELVWACLTLWQNWLALGRPLGDYTFGSFQSWASVMGGVLDAAGVPGFLGNIQEFQDQAVDDHPEWQEFVTLWMLHFGTKLVKPSDLVPIAEGVDGFDLGNASNPAGKAGMLSKALKARRDSRWHEFRDSEKAVDALTIRMDQNSRTGRFEYRLEHEDGREHGPVLSDVTLIPKWMETAPGGLGRSRGR